MSTHNFAGESNVSKKKLKNSCKQQMKDLIDIKEFRNIQNLIPSYLVLGGRKIQIY